MVQGMDLLTGTLQWITTLAAAHPVVTIIVIVAVLLVIVSRTRRSGARKDPTRAFTGTQRSTGFNRAQNRCEFDRVVFWRCRRPAQHGDHWLPHSKGGASSLTNFVAACAKCNLSKSAKMPTPGQTARLKRRRRRYFAPGVDVAVGEWFRG